MKTRWLKNFKDDESGSATIESLLWVPLFVYLLVLITDVSLAFYGKAQALRILQDGNRALSVRRLDDAPAARQYILGLLAEYSTNAQVTTTITDGVITSTAMLPVRDLMAIGSIPGFSQTAINISAQHFLEQ